MPGLFANILLSPLLDPYISMFLAPFRPLETTKIALEYIERMFVKLLTRRNVYWT